MEEPPPPPPVPLQPRSTGSSMLLTIAKKLGLRSLAWLGVYLLGYWDFSLAWMVTPLLLSVLRDTWKKEKRARLTAAREAALSNEQAMLEARMNAEELPAWVFFPDKDRAEWLNRILKQLWPYINQYVRHTLFTVVEPTVESALKPYKLSPFRFEKDRVFLGQVPPRITGIKVYDDQTSRKEIIMDVDLVFASDMEIVFKVKGIPAKISDFGLRGMARIVLKPLISQIPLIGGVQVYFLKAPEIDYTLGGFAGPLEIPGLNNIVEKIILEQVKNFIVLPNKFSMPLVDSVPNKVLKCPDSAGVLRVKLIRATNLVDKDGLGSGKSDPYVIMTVGAHTHRVPTITDTCDPEWNLTYDFPIEVVVGQELLLEFYDDDDRKDDEFLGRAKVQTSVVAQRGVIEGYWVDLVDTESGKVQVTLTWLPVVSDVGLVKAAAKSANPDDSHAKGLVHIFIDSCSGLTNPRDPSYKPSPMVRIISPHERAQQSWPKYNTNDPEIEQGFVMLVKAPYTDEFQVDVIDTASKKKDDVIGTCSVKVWDLVEHTGMEYKLQPWLLKSNSSTAKIVMSASLRGLEAPQVSPRKTARLSITGDPLEISLPNISYDEQVMEGNIKLVIHGASNLAKKDVGGKSDPYTVVKYETQEFKTKVCKKTLEPVWDEEFEIAVNKNGDNQIAIELFDKDKLGKDETLGKTTIDVRRISKQKTLSQMSDNLIGCETGKLLWSAEFVEAVASQAPEPALEPKSEYEPIKLESPTSATIDNEIIIINKKSDDIPVVADEQTAGKDLDTSVVTLAHQEAPDAEHRSFVLPAKTDTGSIGVVQAGFLKVTVHKAEGLIGKDVNGKSDPYVVIKYDGQTNKSKHVSNSLEPEFEFSTGYVIDDDGPADIKIQLLDHDVIGKDESIGTVELDLRRIMKDGDMDNAWVDLKNVKSGRILISTIFKGSGYNDGPYDELEMQGYIGTQTGSVVGTLAETELRKRPVGNRGKLRLNILYDDHKEELKVFLHEAANLPGSDLPDPPDPYVKIYLMPGKKKKKKSKVVKDDGSPQFNEEFDFSIDHQDVPKHYLKFSVVDKKGMFNKSPLLGSLEISLDNPGVFQGLADWYPLEDLEEDSD